MMLSTRDKIIIMFLGNNLYGGGVYERMVLECLGDTCEVFPYNCIKMGDYRLINSLRALASLFIIYKKQKIDNYNIIIKDYYTNILPLWDFRKSIVIVHHLDYSLNKYNKILDFLKTIMLNKLRQADIIMVVSEFWRKYLIDKGFNNVYKIYNCFDIEKFVFDSEDIDEFKQRFNIADKPIIYLGKFDKGKGAAEAFQALRELDAHFVCSGKASTAIPGVKSFNLTYRDYLCLLKASTLAVTMSLFEEGWCRVAHEAMLCQTPVVGSGKGGMRELLEGGKQIICTDFAELKTEVCHLLQQPKLRKKLALEGYAYAKEFTRERFKSEWISLIQNSEMSTKFCKG